MFSFSKSVFRDVCTGIQPRSEVFSEDEIANFNNNGVFVVGTHKHFFVGIQEVSVFRVIQEVSARKLRKELINYNLYLFA